MGFVQLYKAALVSGPSLVSFELEAISMYKAASCDLLYLVRFFGGNHALKMSKCN